MTFWV